MNFFKITSIILFTTIVITSCDNNDDTLENQDSSVITSQADEILRLTEDFDQLRKNEELVRNFYQEFFGDLKLDEAGNKYLGDAYIQHNPNLKDGREELIARAKEWFAGKEPFTVDIRRVFASGDYVFIHTKGRGDSDNRGGFVMDVFRVENDKLVEHWDTMQEIPLQTVSDHPYF